MEPVRTSAGLPRVARLTVQASVRLGPQTMSLSDLCRLAPGAIIPLAIPAASPQELVANNMLMAKGTLVRKGSQLGFRVTSAVLDANAAR